MDDEELDRHEQWVALAEHANAETGPLNELLKEDASLAAHHLMEAFIWDETPEGHDFWLYVQRRLNYIAGEYSHD